FKRVKGNLKRTSEANRFYDQVCVILKEIDKLELINDNQPLRLVSSITIANTELVNIINRFDDDLKISIVNADEVVNMIKNQEGDIGIVEGAYSDEELISKTVGMIPLDFFSRKGKDMNINTLEDLVEYEILLREKGSSVRKAFDDLLFNYALSYQARFESVNSEAILQIMQSSNKDYVSLLPRSLVDLKVFDIIKLNGIHLETPIQLVYRKDKSLSALEMKMISILKTITYC
ncbi:MAG TPA: LysR substrate-binding domain-containing protein, partial [Erysipelothrix sp.]